MADNRVTRGHAPAYLQGFSIGYTPRGLIADQVCPRIDTQKQSDKYRIFGKDIFYLRDGKRAPGAAPNEMRTTYAGDQFFATIFALRHPLLDEERTNADADLKLEARYTQATTQGVALMREKRVSDLFTTSGNHQASHVTTKAAGAEWDTVLATTPDQVITDIDNALGAVADDASIPVSELSIIVPEQVFRKTMQQNAAYLDRIKYSARGVTTPELIAQVHGVRQVILAAGQGVALPEKVVADIAADITTSYLWGDNVWVGLIGEQQNDMTPSFARSFNWTGATGGQPREVLQYRDGDPGTRKDWIEVSEAMDEKITAKLAGGLIKNVLA